MAQEEVNSVPQRGTLLRRAHELLEHLGHSAPENLLIQHLFGSGGNIGNSALWTDLLRQTLRSSSLFEETGEFQWSLSAWKSTQKQLDEVEFVVLDTETTGLRPGPDRVIEVAGVRLQGGKVLDTFQSLINPSRRLPPFIMQFTGISQEMVNRAPAASEVLPDFLHFIEGATLVGHNLSFDINFLSYEARLLGRLFPLDGLDTIALARRLLPGLKRFKLDHVAAHLQIPTANRHRAMGDVDVTVAVFSRLLEQAQQQGIYTLGHLRRRLQLPVVWSGDITQVAPSSDRKVWRADGKLSSASVGSERPTGNLFLDTAWKQNFPAKPGVYLMKDANEQVIYVGKSKNLKERLSSYYHQPMGYTRKIDGLLQSVKSIEIRVLGSELEALLVESQLIKELQPAYNVQLRNYELYPFIKIDIQHTFPRVYATREVAADGARYFGPFRSRHAVDLTIELIQKVFPIRTCVRSLPPQAKVSEPCLRLHLNRCSGPCRGGVDPSEYREVIEQVCAFLGGEREDLLERLRRQMLEASQQLNFERAARLRDALRSVDEVLIGQRLIAGAVEANNLLIVYPSAQENCDEIFLIRHGRLVQQCSISHEPTAIQQAVCELLALAATLGESPAVIGKAEVDQINIISRWIHRHSEDRACFPFQPTCVDEDTAQRMGQRIWTEVDAARAKPFVVDMEDVDEIIED